MAKKATKTSGRPRKPKQGHLTGMEPPSIKEIDNAAERYVDARDERMTILQREIEAQELLHALLVKHSLRTYEYDGKEVTIVASEKVKVSKKKAMDADEMMDEGRKHVGE